MCCPVRWEWIQEDSGLPKSHGLHGTETEPHAHGARPGLWAGLAFQFPELSAASTSASAAGSCPPRRPAVQPHPPDSELLWAGLWSLGWRPRSTPLAHALRGWEVC